MDGAPLPMVLNHATFAQNGRSFLIAGGSNVLGPNPMRSSKIIELDPDKLEWSIKAVEMPEVRSGPYAVMVNYGDVLC